MNTHDTILILKANDLHQAALRFRWDIDKLSMLVAIATGEVYGTKQLLDLMTALIQEPLAVNELIEEE
jgi:hypothetical protein